MIVLVMGVAGSGKTTLAALEEPAEALALALDASLEPAAFVEAVRAILGSSQRLTPLPIVG